MKEGRGRFFNSFKEKKGQNFYSQLADRSFDGKVFAVFIEKRKKW